MLGDELVVPFSLAHALRLLFLFVVDEVLILNMVALLDGVLVGGIDLDYVGGLLVH